MSLPALRCVPLIHFLAHLVSGVSIPLLELALQLLPVAFNDVKVIISELSPLLLDLALDLLPVAFNPIPIHAHFSLRTVLWTDNAEGSRKVPVCQSSKTFRSSCS